MSVAAVVVSFNRLDYLKKCLMALEEQTRPLDEIIVIENGSTDGSAEYVRTSHPGITLYETGANLGGAGGFAWGIELALQRGHSLAWLMDDDAEPHRDALEPLMRAMESEPRPSFAAPLVEDVDGAVVQGNLPTVSTDATAQLAAQKLGGIALAHTTFVGVLIDLRLAAAMPLPYADFFIWFDDVEYTKRLAQSSFGIHVVSARMIHPNNAGLKDMGWRLYYYLRNQLWLTRLNPRPWSLTQRPVFRFAELFVLAIQQFRVAKDKKQWLSGTFKGLSEGMLRLPAVLQPGDLFRTLDAEKRYQLSSRA
ncbi:glycosyltransferase family 2 protein [Arthrobacter sp. NQ7]|jgi:GT2 family glycosyltransferase|uniref:glycosyltransferase family 2 protein n=1 Tax=Arthrobacter sp. NQ7 TaxID=3032303 RepID=UPI00240EA9D2|nr:glycosyltransferase family 2 protein [Arthrobacter sp. NQ7]MDJ0456354.1 glycosyltransferase family 2 protein [Arthrobacter sp. NQ7]